jgi:murein hydrolase activator
VLCIQIAEGQTRKELEKKRSTLQQELKEATSLLEKTTKAQKSTYQRFQVLQTQVQKREELVQTLQREVKMVELQIEANTNETKKLVSEVDKLHKEYGELLQKVYRISMGSEKWMLILSSKDMNQALLRWTYINQIKKSRAEQAELLLTKKSELEEKKKQLEIYKNEKEKLLTDEINQKQQLANELDEKNKVLADLKKDESNIRKKIKDKEIAREKLNIEIQKIIALEIEKQRKEAEAKATAEKAKKLAEEANRKKSTTNSDTKKGDGKSAAVKESTNEAKPKSNNPEALPETPESKTLSQTFATNKGALPWPVSKGTVSQRFGTQPHPIIPSVMISNRGINIRTERGTDVRSVFKGQVVGKRYIPGMEYTVIVQHGSFFTVYSKLDEVVVKEGQKINTGEVLGKASAEEDEIYSEIHFELWQDKTNQDPAAWLLKK